MVDSLPPFGIEEDVGRSLSSDGEERREELRLASSRGGVQSQISRKEDYRSLGRRFRVPSERSSFVRIRQGNDRFEEDEEERGGEEDERDEDFLVEEMKK